MNDILNRFQRPKENACRILSQPICHWFLKHNVEHAFNTKIILLFYFSVALRLTLTNGPSNQLTLKKTSLANRES